MLSVLKYLEILHVPTRYWFSVMVKFGRETHILWVVVFLWPLLGVVFHFSLSESCCIRRKITSLLRWLCLSCKYCGLADHFNPCLESWFIQNCINYCEVEHKWHYILMYLSRGKKEKAKNTLPLYFDVYWISYFRPASLLISLIIFFFFFLLLDNSIWYSLSRFTVLHGLLVTIFIGCFVLAIAFFSPNCSFMTVCSYQWGNLLNLIEIFFLFLATALFP